jgi:hypothetical protein
MNINVVYNPFKSCLLKLKEFFFLITFRDNFERWWTYAIWLCFIPIVWEFVLIYCVAMAIGCVVLGILYYLAVILIRLLPLLLALAAIAVIIRLL